MRQGMWHASERSAYRVFVGNPRQRWEDNIKIDLREIYDGVWTELIWVEIGTSGGLL
jgi:hypothetical protein